MGGPVLGGSLGDAGLWRYIFFINVPIGLFALIILIFKVNESRDESSDKAIDISGASAIALSLACITFGFLRMPLVGFNAEVFATLVAGAVLLVIFIYVEKYSRHPMMPLYLFTNRVFTGVNLLTFFLYAGLGAGMLFLSLNLVQAQGYSQLQSGLTFLPFTMMMILVARFAGMIADKHGPRLLLILGPAVAGTGLLILSFVGQTHGPTEYWTTFFPGIVVFGLGMSFTVAPLTATVMGSVSDHLSGTASGVNNALTRIANVFANAIFGAMAVLFFTGALQQQVNTVHFNEKERQSIMAQAVNLGNARVPRDIDPNNQARVRRFYSESFIVAYRDVMRICAVLAFLGAIMSLLFINNSAVKKER